MPLLENPLHVNSSLLVHLCVWRIVSAQGQCENFKFLECNETNNIEAEKTLFITYILGVSEKYPNGVYIFAPERSIGLCRV